MTTWEVWNPDDGVVKEFGGSQARFAAEAYREEDADDWEEGETLTLAVRKKGTAEWQFFEVLREYDPTYTAVTVKRPDDFELPDEEPAP